MAKKIGAIVSLSIIGILILATIIMANVTVNYGINCATPTEIWINYKSNDPSRERICRNVSEIEAFFKNTSKDNALNALFNKTLNKEAEVVLESNAGATIPTTNGFYVRYRYENPQKLMVGKDEYKDSNGNIVYYNDLVFTINNIDEETEVIVYVVPDKTKSKVYTHYYKLEANLGGLYDYLVEQGFQLEG